MTKEMRKKKKMTCRKRIKVIGWVVKMCDIVQRYEFIYIFFLLSELRGMYFVYNFVVPCYLRTSYN